jgi:hypothetical protein
MSLAEGPLVLAERAVALGPIATPPAPPAPPAPLAPLAPLALESAARL